jgi:hypothetical protein
LINIIVGVFFVLHGLVHLLYFGQGWRIFELTPGLTWPDQSWAFARLLGDQATRVLASAACILAAVGFAAGGVAIFLKQSWWHPAVVGSAVFSSVLYLLFWDGEMQKLNDKGWIGILINLAILGIVLLLRWPKFDF